MFSAHSKNLYDSLEGRGNISGFSIEDTEMCIAHFDVASVKLYSSSCDFL